MARQCYQAIPTLKATATISVFCAKNAQSNIFWTNVEVFVLARFDIVIPT